MTAVILLEDKKYILMLFKILLKKTLPSSQKSNFKINARVLLVFTHIYYMTVNRRKELHKFDMECVAHNISWNITS